MLIAFIVMFTIYSVDKGKNEPNLSLSVAFMLSSIYYIGWSSHNEKDRHVQPGSRGR